VIRLMPEKNLGYDLLAAVESKRGNSAAALALYQRLPLPVTSASLASNIGTAYYYEGKFDEARRYYLQAVGLEPRNANTRACLGDWYARQGKADSASAEYTRAAEVIDTQLHVDPRNVKLRLDRALLDAKLGQCDASRATLEEVSSQVSPTDAEQALRIAKAKAVCREDAGAIAEIRRALKLGAAFLFVQKQDEFRALARDPAFVALGQTKKG
jgi:tetratricopeptide (TPR) repeat protein